MTHLHHKVSALIDGELQGASRRRALRHLRACAACQHEVEATLALKHRLVGMPATEPSADLFATLEGVSGETLGDQPVVAVGRGQTRRLLVGAGSLSIVVLSIAYVVGSPDPTMTAVVSPPVEDASADFAGVGVSSPLSDPAVDSLVAAFGSTAVVAAANRRQPVASPGPVSGLGIEVVSIVPTGDDAKAVRALGRAVDAADEVAYQATREVDSFDEDTVTRVTVQVDHRPDQGTTYTVAQAGSDVTPVFVESDGESLGGLTSAPLDLLTDNYDLALSGTDDVAGRSATTVEVGDAGVVVAKFWIDDETGILLRRDLYHDGAVVRSSVVTRLDLSRDAFVSHLAPKLRVPEAMPIDMAAAAQLGDDGWTCPASLAADYTLTRLGHLEQEEGVMMATYSDGLSTLSIFEQRGTIATAALGGYDLHEIAGADVYVRYGLPSVAVWESGGLVYTAVTDMPTDQVAELVAHLPHAGVRADEAGVLDRVGTGLARMAAFVNPVD